MAAIAVLISGVTWMVKLILFLFIAIQMGWSIRNFWQPEYVHICWHSEGHWTILDKNSQEIPAILMTSVRQRAWLILRLCPAEGKSFYAVLLSDNLDAETRRCLRVRLEQS